MNLIADMWRFAELCSHDDQDYGDNDDDKFDFIKDTLTNKYSDVIVTIMQNSLDYAYIAEFEDRVIICFRGTDGADAWYNNFNFYPLIDNYIHKGFYDSFEVYKNSIRDYLKNCQDKKIYVTGHSRGGILSQFCSLYLIKELKYTDVTCVNFGAPVGGTQKFADELNKYVINNFRVVNGYDIVTRVFDDTLGRHGGKLVWMKEPKWHLFFFIRKLYDHAYSQYTDSIIKYSKNINDIEAVDELKIVKKRVNI